MWRFLDAGVFSGAMNMAIDESLALQVKAGECPPTLRLYGWSPHAISIGKNQSLSDFDLEKLSGDGIDIVRRPTGGRAILHSNEITYAAVLPTSGSTLRSIYHRINESLLAGLRILGLEAELTIESPDFRSLYAQPTSLPCFSLSARSEIHVRGKKLIGSAQRRFGTSVLQHGSFLLGSDHKNISNYISSSSPQLRKTLIDQLEQRTTDAATVLRRTVTFDEAADCLRRGFEATSHVSRSIDEASLIKS